MKKILFRLSTFLLLTLFIACSSDDDNNSSTLTVNGQSVKFFSVEGEYDPEGSFDYFTFWINDITSTSNSIYMQATIPYTVKLVSGVDITNDCSILMQWDGGSEYIMGDYRSGKLTIENFDTKNKIATLKFDNYKCVSNLRNETILNGTLIIPYKVIEYGSAK